MGELEQNQGSGDLPPGTGLNNLAGQQIGRYRIERQIGSGGVATVYQAYDQVQQLPVALKVLPPTADEKTYGRFRREAFMAGSLRHDHIVRILQVGSAGQGTIAYIAMELVEGQSLGTLLNQHFLLQPNESCAVLEPIARALDFANRAGIVHRDVKPSNILLRTVTPGTPHSIQLNVLDQPVVPLLSDFGIARLLDAPELTSTGRTVGTPAYMAPEQCAGRREIDGRADIYALGMVLYRCVTGRLPFTGTVTQILHAHVYEPLPIDAAIMQRLPPLLVEVLRRSLAKEPKDRYTTAGEMADALAAISGRARMQSNQMPSEATSTLTLSSPMLTNAAMPTPSTMAVLVPGAASNPNDVTPQQELPRARPPSASMELLDDDLVEQKTRTREERLYRLTWALLPVALSILVIAISFAVLRSTLNPRTNVPPTVLDTPTVPVVVAINPTATSASGASAPTATSAESGGVVPTVTPLPTDGPAATPVPLDTPTSPPPTDTPTLPPPTSTDTPLPTATPLPTPTVTPGATPTIDPNIGANCPMQIPDLLRSYIATLGEEQRQSFGCPMGVAIEAQGELLRFQNGLMVRLDDDPSTIYLAQISDDKPHWSIQRKNWQDGEPLTPDAPAPPDPKLFLPTRAMGKVWQEGGEALQKAMGYATSAEPARFSALRQSFPDGILIANKETNEIFVIR